MTAASDEEEVSRTVGIWQQTEGRHLAANDPARTLVQEAHDAADPSTTRLAQDSCRPGQLFHAVSIIS